MVAAGRVAAGAHQLCGGWGHLAGAGLHLYTRAIKAAEGQLGTPSQLRAGIAGSPPSASVAGPAGV